MITNTHGDGTHEQARDGEQTLAITIGLLLLVGTTLLLSCWTGPVTAFVLIAVPVLGAYVLPSLVRVLALRRAVRRLLG
ncbi:hypothetical protein [Streptomyces sp. PanSC9]|uniref:hypothetical protein n=1 Tax=Streptomyces sp. PanSC9 TaxID=1520461 RepID=UPI0011CDE1D1|nr:hypothetical protein [Streptomyces sp. PanSC9]